MKFLAALLLFVFISPASHQATAQNVYKYKNEKGKWVFGDKPPVNTSIQVESLKLDSTSEKKKSSVVLSQNEENGIYTLTAENKLHADVQLRLKSRENTDDVIYNGIIKKLESKVIYRGTQKLRYRYRWAIGAVNTKHSPCCLSVPFQHYKPLRVSQGFNGKYSHQSAYSRYAIDISMPMGTNILAARDGIVFYARDGFALSGNSQYFLDKTNMIKIVHADGSYTSYAHLLEGSLTVKEGDEVFTGQVIARSGNSGYSTGPHLHFAQMRNLNMNIVSVPFQFSHASNGESFTPKRGMHLVGGVR